MTGAPLPATVRVPFLDAACALDLEDGATDDYARACVAHLGALDGATIDDLCRASARYRADLSEAVGAEAVPLASPRDVLAWVRPRVMIVPDPGGRPEPVVHLECDCEWEVEHGLEWVVRAGRAVYVGPFEDVDPWDDSDGGYL